MILVSRNRDYLSHFSLIFETTRKLPIVFFCLVFGKVGVDGVNGPRREMDVRYESDLKMVLKGLRYK